MFVGRLAYETKERTPLDEWAISRFAAADLVSLD
jgi:hypothetical protein